MNSLSKFVSLKQFQKPGFQDNSLVVEAIPGGVLVERIFSRLSFQEWLIVAQVNKRMNGLLTDRVLLKEKIYKEVVFNPEDWGVHFGFGLGDGERAWKELPEGIGELLKGRSPVSEYLRFWQTHVIVWIPAGLSMNKYVEFLKIKVSEGVIKKVILDDSILKVMGSVVTKKAEWIVMPRKRSKNASQVYKMVDFEILSLPKALEAMICMTAMFCKTGGSNKFDAIKCQEREMGCDVVVNFDRSSLNVFTQKTKRLG